MITLPMLWEIHEASIKNVKEGGTGAEAVLLASLIHCSIICWTLAGNQELHESLFTLNWYRTLCDDTIRAAVTESVTEQARILRIETQQRIEAVWRKPEA